MDKNIVLIGFMGTGKTTIGILLANRLGYNFVDTDGLIVDKLKMSIPDIFALHGEEYFRRLEKSILTAVMENNRQVISTGGGIVLNPENRALILEKGLVIALEASLEELWKRLSKDKSRPLLFGENPRKKMEELYLSRKSLYHQAHFRIFVDHKSPEEIVSEILSRIQEEDQD